MSSADRLRRWPVLVLLAALIGILATSPRSRAAEKLDVCAQATEKELAILSHKPLFPTPQERGCFWSRTPGAMAYLHISVQEHSKPLRDYFNKELAATTQLVAITDLGDEGLMSVVEGSLGVIVIRKGKQVVVSAVTFLDIEPGSDKQRALWDIYRRLVNQL